MNETLIAKYARLPDWFLSFCDPVDSGVRYQLHKPFVQAGYIYATDGRAAVRVREELVQDAPRPPEGPEAKHVPRDMGGIIFGHSESVAIQWEPIVLPEDAGPMFKLCPECNGEPTKPRREECDECGGDGNCPECHCGPCGDCDGKGHFELSDCGWCDNKGKSIDFTPVFIPGPSIYLGVANIRRLLDAGATAFIRKNAGPHDMLRFTVGEDFEGRLMPCTSA